MRDGSHSQGVDFSCDERGQPFEFFENKDNTTTILDGSHQSFASSVSGTTSTSDIQQHNEDEVSTPVISNRILLEQTVPVIQLPSPAMMETNSQQSKVERNSSRNGRIQKQLYVNYPDQKKEQHRMFANNCPRRSLFRSQQEEPQENNNTYQGSVPVNSKRSTSNSQRSWNGTSTSRPQQQ
jgi:hypothetical protein